MLISLIAFTEWHWLAQKLSLIERENVSELFLISPDESSMIGFFASLRFQAHKIVGQDDFICACVLLAAYTLVFGGFNSGCRSRTFKHSRPFRWLVIQPTTQTACFSQSQQPARQVESLCVLLPLTVALSAMSHLWSVCWLKTYCLCSPLCFPCLLFSLRLFVSPPSLHSFVLVWVGFCHSSFASLLLHLIFVLNWGNNLPVRQN